MYEWEEKFMDDACALSRDGVSLGYIKPVGGSWSVYAGDELIAIRPDKLSAQRALLRYAEASK